MKQASLIAICALLLGGVYVTKAVAADHGTRLSQKRITSLERRVRELERRLEKYKRSGAGPAYLRDRSRQYGSGGWGMIRKGMARSEVVKLLGRPMKTSKGKGWNYLTYAYPRGGMVGFDTQGKLIRWQMPTGYRDRYDTNGRSSAWIGWVPPPGPQAWPHQNWWLVRRPWTSPAQGWDVPPAMAPVIRPGWDAPPQAQIHKKWWPAQPWAGPAWGWSAPPQAWAPQYWPPQQWEPVQPWAGPTRYRSAPPHGRHISGWGWAPPGGYRQAPYEKRRRKRPKYWDEP